MATLIEVFYAILDKFPPRGNQALDVAMFHTGRCGSSVLGLMLDQHSQVNWAREIFAKHMQAADSGALSTTEVEHIIEAIRLETAASDALSPKSVEYIAEASGLEENHELFGFETKYLPEQHLSHQCINMGLADYVALLRRMQFGKFIVLHRKNYLRRQISARVAYLTKSWHSQHGVKTPTKIMLDVDAFCAMRKPIIESFEGMDNALADLKRVLKRRRTLFLSYEDDILEDPNLAYLKVCSFLKIPEEGPEIYFSRTNPFRCQDVITNYDEVEKILRNTRYGWMLDD